jgi:hypothetical protein
LALSPQLDPPDIAAMEQVVDRGERERLYTEQSIYRRQLPQGVRYTKGNNPQSVPRSWQSLDLILRSDRDASEALPLRKIRASRVLTALTAISTMALVAGISMSAREGLDFRRLTGTSALLLSGGAMTLGFGMGAGITYNQARVGYDRAVDIYNDSLGMRLGVLKPSGEYKPPSGVLVDDEGFILLDDASAGPLPPVSSTRVPKRPAPAEGATPAPSPSEPEPPREGDSARDPG